MRAKLKDTKNAKVSGLPAGWRQKEVRALFGRLTADDRREFDRWRHAEALDSERRTIADDAFNAIRASAERLRHSAIVREWEKKHFSSDDAPDTEEGTMH